MRQIINQHIASETRESNPRAYDLQHNQLATPQSGDKLYILWATSSGTKVRTIVTKVKVMT